MTGTSSACCEVSLNTASRERMRSHGPTWAVIMALGRTLLCDMSFRNVTSHVLQNVHCDRNELYNLLRSYSNFETFHTQGVKHDDDSRSPLRPILHGPSESCVLWSLDLRCFQLCAIPSPSSLFLRYCCRFTLPSTLDYHQPFLPIPGRVHVFTPLASSWPSHFSSFWILALSIF